MTPEKAGAIQFARIHADAMMFAILNPKPIAVRGLNPPHRPQGTPSRKQRSQCAALCAPAPLALRRARRRVDRAAQIDGEEHVMDFRVQAAADAAMRRIIVSFIAGVTALAPIYVLVHFITKYW